LRNTSIRDEDHPGKHVPYLIVIDDMLRVSAVKTVALSKKDWQYQQMIQKLEASNLW